MGPCRPALGRLIGGLIRSPPLLELGPMNSRRRTLHCVKSVFPETPLSCEFISIFSLGHQ